MLCHCKHLPNYSDGDASLNSLNIPSLQAVASYC